MKVVFIANQSVNRVFGWSGTPYFSFRETKKRFSQCIALETPILDYFLDKMRSIFIVVGIDVLREDYVSRLYALVLGPRIKRINPDAVISVASSAKAGRLEIQMPIIHVSDATFRVMVKYYPNKFFSGLSKRSVRMGDLLEQRILDNCTVAALSSQWAANSAVNDYGLSRNKVCVVPLGANFDSDPTFNSDTNLIERKIVLLFVGVVWERKGGPLAFRVLSELLERGVPAELHVVGCEAPETIKDSPHVVCHGFLDKSDPAALNTLNRLYENASFLIVPSRQEAYGLAFAEASAYGLPILATNTGGVATVVEQGVNGFLFDLDESETRYVDTILNLRAAPEKYRQLRISSRSRYKSHLSWDAWGQRMEQIVAEAVNGGKQTRSPN
jgi:glycosyltransferase involved in cell wall biosynthesis